MAKVQTAQNVWQAGMKRDLPRNRMPPGTCWNAVDLILNYGAPIRQRGGWGHWSDDISAITANSAAATYIRGGLHAIYADSAGGATQKNIAIDEDGHVFNVTTEGAAASIGAGVTVVQNPVFHGGTAASAATAVYTGLAIIPDGTGGAVPKKYDGSSLTNLGGTPPKGRFATVYKDFTILGNGSVSATEFPARIWFSPPGDPDCGFSGSVTAWDTENSWIDFSQPIKGFGPTKNALLVFGDSAVARVRGSTPPPDEDMVVDDPLFQVGLLDAFSIVLHKENVFWSAPEGVFRSDGVVLDDLTKKGGMLRYWLDLVGQATSTWTCAAGIIRDQMMIVLMDGTTFKDAFLIDLQSYTWTRHSNIDATSFWTGLDGESDELYWGRRGAARVGTMDSIFASVGASAFASDGDGDAVLPVLETNYYEFGQPGLKRIKAVYVGHYLDDYATNDPTCAVTYVLLPEATSYTSAGTLSEGTGYKRIRIPIGVQSPGIALKLTRAATGDFQLHDIGFDQHPLERSRLAQ